MDQVRENGISADIVRRMDADNIWVFWEAQITFAEVGSYTVNILATDVKGSLSWKPNHSLRRAQRLACNPCLGGGTSLTLTRMAVIPWQEDYLLDKNQFGVILIV